MKFGPVLTYKDIEEAKKLVGKKVLYSDYLGAIKSDDCSSGDTLLAVREDSIEPFLVETARYHADREDMAYQFIREILSDEPDKPRYEPYDLSDRKVRDSLRGRWYRVEDPDETREDMINRFLFSPYTHDWWINGWDVEGFLKHCRWIDDGTPCGRRVE